MKTVKIKRMSLRNFKGIKSFEAEFNGTTKIFGDNATGKTTLVDAFMWLLFGKDSTGRKDFAIKTFTKENEVIHKLDHEVECVFDIDGDMVVLKRIFREKWVTKRGSQEPDLQGHETLFFWNEVPMQAKEFQAKVDEIISEQTFKLITSPFYFNTLKWQERRNILTSIAGNVSDKEIAATSLEFSALFNNMGKKTLDEFKKEVSAKKKKLKDELKEIPARIDELVRNTPEAKDWKWIQDEIETVKKNIDIIDEELIGGAKANQTVLDRIKKHQEDINDLKIKISNIEHKGRQTFQNQLNEKTSAISNANSEIQRIERKQASNGEEINRLKTSIKVWEEAQENLRNKWEEVNEEAFPGFNKGEFVCPTCKQELPAEVAQAKKSELLSNFNANKEQRLTEINKEGSGYSIKIENAQKEIAALSMVDLTMELKKQKDIITQWENEKLQSVQSILSDDPQYKKLNEELQALENMPEDKPGQKVDNSTLKEKRRGLELTLDGLKKDLGIKSQIDASEQRKSQLLKQEKSYSSQLAELEQTEFTIQEFIKTKVDSLESKINSLFSGVKFRMFDEQLNGGLIECCDTIIDGVPWADANNAARINAGISIINVLSNHFKQIAPIWIDNSESITSIKDTDSQRIELYVSEAHKELEVV